MKHLLFILIPFILFSCGSDDETADVKPAGKIITYTIENRSNTSNLDIKLYYTDMKYDTAFISVEKIDTKTLPKGVYTKTVICNTKYKSVFLHVRKTKVDTVKFRIGSQQIYILRIRLILLLIKLKCIVVLKHC
jgi:uncharacterized OB-fold protein